jgi:hypothetical protein
VNARSIGLALLALVLCVLVPRQVLAAERVRVVVGAFEGDKDGGVRTAIVQALQGKDNVLVVSADHAAKIADSLGSDPASAKGIQGVSKAISLGAWIDGSVKSASGVWTATLKLRSPKDGEVSETHKFRAGDVAALADKVKSGVWKALGPAIKDAPKPKSGGKKRVAVLSFTGSKSGTVRSYAVSALKKAKGIGVVPDKSLRDLELPEDPKAEDIVSAAAILDAALLITGSVDAKKGKYTVDVIARNGADGQVMAEFSLSGRGLLGLRGTVVKDLPKKLAGPFERAAVPEPPEEQLAAASGSAGDGETAEEEEEEEEEEEASPGDDKRPSPLEIIGGIRAFSRNFRYTDDLFDALRSYKLGAAPAFFIQGRWYPAAHFSGGIPAHIGLTGGYEQGVFLKSQVSGGEELTTKMSEWYAGLRYRVPFEKHELGVQGTYGKHSFKVEDDPAAPLVPDVDYSYLRFGLDGRVRVDQILLGAHFGYRMLLDTGELQSSAWFPNTGGGGVDAGLFAGYEFITGVALVAGFDFRRYFFSFDPSPGDPLIAGGAVDEYLSGWGGLSVRLPGDE